MQLPTSSSLQQRLGLDGRWPGACGSGRAVAHGGAVPVDGYVDGGRAGAAGGCAEAVGGALGRGWALLADGAQLLVAAEQRQLQGSGDAWGLTFT